MEWALSSPSLEAHIDKSAGESALSFELENQ